MDRKKRFPVWARKLQISLIAGLSLLGSADTVFSVQLIGRASIVDGDTLEIHRTRIRLSSIDASEDAQLCRG